MISSAEVSVAYRKGQRPTSVCQHCRESARVLFAARLVAAPLSLRECRHACPVGVFARGGNSVCYKHVCRACEAAYRHIIGIPDAARPNASDTDPRTICTFREL
ncbi:hypothetical protein MRX96_043493 [Rhipicephalus microplus]